jgi:hypothetical protein
MAGIWTPNSGICVMTETETPRPRSSSGRFMMASSALAVLMIVLYFWRPWYTRENAARLSELRNNVVELQGTSIAQFLQENPTRKEDAVFVNPPTEYWALDATMSYAAIASAVWLPLMLAVLIYRTMQADRARGKKLYDLNCPFCSHVIAKNVRSLGQTMTCPNCHAVVHARDMRWTASLD